MKEADFPFGDVVAISGSGQQHGSVYWRKGSEEFLKTLDPAQTLSDQLQVEARVAVDGWCIVIVYAI